MPEYLKDKKIRHIQNDPSSLFRSIDYLTKGEIKYTKGKSKFTTESDMRKSLLNNTVFEYPLKDPKKNATVTEKIKTYIGNPNLPILLEDIPIVLHNIAIDLKTYIETIQLNPEIRTIYPKKINETDRTYENTIQLLVLNHGQTQRFLPIVDKSFENNVVPSRTTEILEPQNFQKSPTSEIKTPKTSTKAITTKAATVSLDAQSSASFVTIPVTVVDTKPASDAKSALGVSSSSSSISKTSDAKASDASVASSASVPTSIAVPSNASVPTSVAKASDIFVPTSVAIASDASVVSSALSSTSVPTSVAKASDTQTPTPVVSAASPMLQSKDLYYTCDQNSDLTDLVVNRFEIVNVPGDGNCLYHSISTALNNYEKTNDSIGESLRIELKDYMNTNEEVCRGIIQKIEETNTFEAILSRVSKNEWGETEEIALISKMKDICIFVHTDREIEFPQTFSKGHYIQGNSYEIPDEIENFIVASCCKEKIIHLRNHANIHYVALKPIYDTNVTDVATTDISPSDTNSILSSSSSKTSSKASSKSSVSSRGSSQKTSSGSSNSSTST